MNSITITSNKMLPGLAWPGQHAGGGGARPWPSGAGPWDPLKVPGPLAMGSLRFPDLRHLAMAWRRRRQRAVLTCGMVQMLPWPVAWHKFWNNNELIMNR